MTVTIGSQTNVPDPGAPITSPWAQDTARKLVHTFANAAARDAWSTRPDGAMAVTTDTDRLYLFTGTAWVEIPNVTDGDARYVNVAGDTMSGNLIVGGDPTVGAGWQVRADGPMLNHTRPPNALLSASLNLIRNGSPTADAGGLYIKFERSGAQIGSVTIGAGGTSVAYNTTSDERLKVRDGDITDAADRVQQLAAAAFRGRWRDGDSGEPTGEAHDLLYAHDIAAAAPYVVTGERGAVDGDDQPIMQQVDYGALVPLLVAALGEALNRITALEAAGS
jgi:hypothetical protein